MNGDDNHSSKTNMCVIVASTFYRFSISILGREASSDVCPEEIADHEQKVYIRKACWYVKEVL